MHVGTRRPAIDDRSIRWERVQLVIEARVGPAVSDRPAAPSAATRSVADGAWRRHGVERQADCLTSDYNVITGLDRDRLPAGRWASRAAGRARRSGRGRPRRRSSRRGRSVLERGLFRLAPGVRPGDPDARSCRIASTRRSSAGRTGLARRPGPAGAVGRWRPRAPVRLRGRLFRLRSRLRRVTTVASAGSCSRRRSSPSCRATSGPSTTGWSSAGWTASTTWCTALFGRRRRPARLPRPGPPGERARPAPTVIVLDDYVADRSTGSTIGPAVRVIQLWHAAGAFKTVGYSRVGKPTDADTFARVHKKYTAAIVSSDHDVPFYAEAFGIPEDSVVPTGIPRMDRFFDERARAAGLAAARAAFPADRGPDDDPVRPDLPRRRAASPRTSTSSVLDYAALHALAVEKDAVVDHQAASVRGAAARHPGRVPRPPARRVAAPPSTSTTCCSRSTCSSPTIRRSCSSSRPSAGRCCSTPTTSTTTSRSRDFYVPFETFVPGRIVRTFPEVARRDPARRLRGRQGGAVRRAAISPISTPDRPTGSSTSSSSPDEGPRPHHPDRRRAARLRVARLLPLRSRVVLATAHSARLAGNLVSIRDDLAGASPGDPGGRPRPPAGAGPARPGRRRSARR